MFIALLVGFVLFIGGLSMILRPRQWNQFFREGHILEKYLSPLSRRDDLVMQIMGVGVLMLALQLFATILFGYDLLGTIQPSETPRSAP
jgi:uncharacterized protein YjeT (DUF2065 family)